MRTLLLRVFEVARPREVVWERLARPADWPSWAAHIRAVDVEPPGILTPASVGVVRLRNRIRSRFVVTAFTQGERWLWAARFLWLRVAYDHVLRSAAPGRTEVTFRVEVGGLGTATLGRLFAWVYARNLDRAIPRLVAELEGGRPAA